MSDHPLDGVHFSDQWHGKRRLISFEDGVLTVELRDDEDYSSVERHFRLTEVKQQWVEVEQ